MHNSRIYKNCVRNCMHTRVGSLPPPEWRRFFLLFLAHYCFLLVYVSYPHYKLPLTRPLRRSFSLLMVNLTQNSVRFFYIMGAAILDDVTVMVADDRSRGYIAVCEEKKNVWRLWRYGTKVYRLLLISVADIALWNECL